MLSWFDIAILVYLALPLPMMAVLGYRRMVRKLAEGDDSARAATYRQTIIEEWLTLSVLLLIWLGAGRGLADLGFTFSNGWRFWLGTGLAIAAAALLYVQTVTTLKSSDSLERFRRRASPVVDMMPHTERDLRTYNALSVTAGICEEIIYRGYAMWALERVGGVWWALAGSTLLFSLGHLYQGTKSLPGILVVGLVLGSLYLLAESLWAPVLLHIAVDLSSGRMAHAAAKTAPS